MHIHLGEDDGLALFYDSEDESLNAVGEHTVASVKVRDGALESLRDNYPPLTEAFNRHGRIVDMLDKHDLSIKMITSNLAQVHNEDEAEAIQAEVTERMEFGNFVQITDEAVLFSTQFGYVLGMMMTK